MNYATSMRMPLFINSNFSITFEKKVDKEVKYLIEDARQAIAEAREENKFGHIATGLALTEGQTDAAKLNNFAVISAWHYERGIEKYRSAIKYLKIAAIHDLPEKYVKYVALQIRESEKQMNLALEQKGLVQDLKASAVAA